MTLDPASFIQILWSLLIDCILIIKASCFCLSNGIWNKNVLKVKCHLYLNLNFFIFSLFESIALYVYLKKKLFCVVNVPQKIFTGYIFYINSILFGFDVNFYFKYLLSSNRFFPDTNWYRLKLTVMILALKHGPKLTGYWLIRHINTRIFSCQTRRMVVKFQRIAFIHTLEWRRD